MSTETNTLGALDVEVLHRACKEAGVEFDAAGGVGGGPIAQPRTESSLAALIAALAGSAGGAAVRVVPVGHGGQLSWCRPDASLAPASFLQLSMRTLLGDGPASGVVEYVPGDGTLTALAGADISVLRATVAAGGHRLTPAIFSESTLGGVLAAGRSGLDRHSLGPIKHHLLGMRMIDGSGRQLRSGGRLVKNVTGFDLHRLHAGGRGIFGPIVEASMRLMPTPEAEQYLTSGPCASATEAVELALSIRRAPKIREQALFVRDRVVHVLLSGRGRQVEADRRRLEELLVGLTEHDPGPGAVAFHLAGEVAATARLSTVPSRVAGVVSALEEAMGDLLGAVVQPGVAQVDIPEALASGASSWPASLDAELSVRGALPEPLRASLSTGNAPHGSAQAGPTPAHPTPAHPTQADPTQADPAASGPESRWAQRLVNAYDPAGLFQTRDFPARS